MVGDTELRKAFGDIVKGHSVCQLFGEMTYILHLGHFSQLDFDEVHDFHLNKALKKGIYKEKDAIQFIIKNGLWSTKEEDEMERIKTSVEVMKTNRKMQKLPSQLKIVDRSIAEEEGRYNALYNERASKLGLTAEIYADQKTNNHYIFKSFYKDKNFTQTVFTEEEFGNLEENEIYELIGVYNNAIKRCALDNIKRIALKPFFQNYYYICDNLYDFYGKPAVDLTYNQVSLVNYGKYFKNIIQNTEKIPEHLFDDPDKLIDYVNVKKNADDTLSKTKRGKEGEGKEFTSLVGATDEDYKALNLDREKGVNLNTIAKDKGGSLDMKDFMKLSGLL